MVNFIDETADSEGTPLNRANLMAIQGFISVNTLFYSDESGKINTIIETNSDGDTLKTDINDNGDIVETFTSKDKSIVKTIQIQANGTIVEVLS